MSSPIVFTVNTEPRLFEGLLQEYGDGNKPPPVLLDNVQIVSDWMHEQQEQVKEQLSSGEFRLVLCRHCAYGSNFEGPGEWTFQANYFKRENQGPVQIPTEVPPLIVFAWREVRPNCIRITGECKASELLNYYQQILRTISQEYPEADNSIQQYLKAAHPEVKELAEPRKRNEGLFAQGFWDGTPHSLSSSIDAFVHRFNTCGEFKYTNLPVAVPQFPCDRAWGLGGVFRDVKHHTDPEKGFEGWPYAEIMAREIAGGLLRVELWHAKPYEREIRQYLEQLVKALEIDGLQVKESVERTPKDEYLRGSGSKRQRIPNHTGLDFVDAALHQAVQKAIEDGQFAGAPLPTLAPRRAVGFFVNASDNDFTNWLEQHARSVRYPNPIPIENGHVQLTRFQREHYPNGYELTMGASCCVLNPDDESQTSHSRGLGRHVIVFRVQRLAAERSQVSAECWAAGFLPYFSELLQDVAKLYPEAAADIRTNLLGQGQTTGTQTSNEPARKPLTRRFFVPAKSSSVQAVLDDWYRRFSREHPIDAVLQAAEDKPGRMSFALWWLEHLAGFAEVRRHEIAIVLLDLDGRAEVQIEGEAEDQDVADSLMEKMSEYWPDAKVATQETPFGDNKGSDAAKQMPKGKRILIPDFMVSLPRKYWQLVDSLGHLPTNEELARSFFVEISTIKRRIKNYRATGNKWPPSRPTND